MGFVGLNERVNIGESERSNDEKSVYNQAERQLYVRQRQAWARVVKRRSSEGILLSLRCRDGLLSPGGGVRKVGLPEHSGWLSAL